MTGSKIKRTRESFGWTQQQLANKLFTSVVVISRWENGHTEPSPIYKRALEKVFGIK